MEWSGGFTELPIDPVLEANHHRFSFKAEGQLLLSASRLLFSYKKLTE